MQRKRDGLRRTLRCEVWTSSNVFLLCPLLRKLLCALESLNTAETVRKHHLLTVHRRLFVNSRPIGLLKYNTVFDWLRVSCWPKVDSQRVGNAGSKKNSCYTIAPCASPEWVWSNHREPVCTQTILNYDTAWLPWSSHATILLCLHAFMDNYLRCWSPVMTPNNYTGNFV